jgi:hypothetical protein
MIRWRRILCRSQPWGSPCEERMGVINDSLLMHVCGSDWLSTCILMNSPPSPGLSIIHVLRAWSPGCVINLVNVDVLCTLCISLICSIVITMPCKVPHCKVRSKRMVRTEKATQVGRFPSDPPVCGCVDGRLLLAARG